MGRQPNSPTADVSIDNSDSSCEGSSICFKTKQNSDLLVMLLMAICGLEQLLADVSGKAEAVKVSEYS